MTTWQTAIVFYLALGCAYGLYGVLALYFPQLRAVAFAEHPGLWLAGCTFLALFVGLGLSAYGLWRTRRYSWATVALQIGQLVGFCLGGCKYQFEAGTTLECFYDGHRIEYTINPMTAEFAVGLHLGVLSGNGRYSTLRKSSRKAHP